MKRANIVIPLGTNANYNLRSLPYHRETQVRFEIRGPVGYRIHAVCSMQFPARSNRCAQDLFCIGYNNDRRMFGSECMCGSHTISRRSLQTRGKPVLAIGNKYIIKFIKNQNKRKKNVFAASFAGRNGSYGAFRCQITTERMRGRNSSIQSGNRTNRNRSSSSRRSSNTIRSRNSNGSRSGNGSRNNSVSGRGSGNGASRSSTRRTSNSNGRISGNGSRSNPVSVRGSGNSNGAGAGSVTGNNSADQAEDEAEDREDTANDAGNDDAVDAVDVDTAADADDTAADADNIAADADDTAADADGEANPDAGALVRLN